MASSNSLTGGGFLPPSLPSPTPSAQSSLHDRPSPLPHPRSHPLVPGSKKEDVARRYVENKLLLISRRYTKKFQILPEDEQEGSVKGYFSFADVVRDLNEIVDVIWLSGTPSLQIPYLLQIAVSLTTYLPSFPPAPEPTFSLLQKLDHAFASMISGRDRTTGDLLPGLEEGPGAGFSRTELVRLKSVVMDARVAVLEVMENHQRQGENHVEAETETETATETEGEADTISVEADDRGDVLGMRVAKVYEATIEQLNLVLGGDVFDATAG